jgi:hypothetical protein
VFYSRILSLNPDLICETHTAVAKTRSTALADRPFRLKTGVERQARQRATPPIGQKVRIAPPPQKASRPLPIS